MRCSVRRKIPTSFTHMPCVRLPSCTSTFFPSHTLRSTTGLTCPFSCPKNRWIWGYYSGLAVVEEGDDHVIQNRVAPPFILDNVACVALRAHVFMASGNLGSTY
ncbi:hypothetical protein ZEAMMB73_Zm00001d048790 [Zea mays]|uniref:Uncharacterized protein n=2 Tax=Zea mays TaxID=4577 RepID=A0A1D6PQ39_MAIZE|nr:hypothetical protein ZEAMMB73_Zm00001d048790 [Zea mays]